MQGFFLAASVLKSAQACITDTIPVDPLGLMRSCFFPGRGQIHADWDHRARIGSHVQVDLEAGIGTAQAALAGTISYLGKG